MEQSKLSAPIKKIFMGVLIYVAAGFIYSIIDPYISSIESVAGLAAFAGAKVDIPVFPRIINWIALAGLVCGYVFTFMGLKGFKEISAEPEAKAIGQLNLSYIFLAIATAVNFIDTSFLNWTAGILITLAPIFMVMGYNKLKNAEVYNKEMKGGFSILFLAAVIMIVGEGLDLILPDFVGSILRSICIVPAFIITLIGWNKVKRGAVKA